MLVTVYDETATICDKIGAFVDTEVNIALNFVEMLRRHFEDWESEAQCCLEHEPPLVIPALEATLKTSHLFNLLDARGAVSVTERVGLIARVRRNAVAAAKAYVEQRENLGFPLGGAPTDAGEAV